jgi:hypothetical protein
MASAKTATSATPAEQKARAQRLHERIAVLNAGAKPGPPRSPRDFVEETMRQEPQPAPGPAKRRAPRPPRGKR